MSHSGSEDSATFASLLQVGFFVATFFVFIFATKNFRNTTEKTQVRSAERSQQRGNTILQVIPVQSPSEFEDYYSSTQAHTQEDPSTSSLAQFPIQKSSQDKLSGAVFDNCILEIKRGNFSQIHGNVTTIHVNQYDKEECGTLHPQPVLVLPPVAPFISPLQTASHDIASYIQPLSMSSPHFSEISYSDTSSIEGSSKMAKGVAQSTIIDHSSRASSPGISNWLHDPPLPMKQETENYPSYSLSVLRPQTVNPQGEYVKYAADSPSTFSFPSLPTSFDSRLMQYPSMPTSQDTEAYLRKSLSIPDTCAVNLWSLPDSAKLPNISDMIKLAIWGSLNHQLTLRQIYGEIEARYPHLKDAQDKPWQRSIRHNLSLKAMYIREECPQNNPGKGCYWALNIAMGEGNKRDLKRTQNFMIKEEDVLNTYDEAPQTNQGTHIPTPVGWMKSLL